MILPHLGQGFSFPLLRDTEVFGLDLVRMFSLEILEPHASSYTELIYALHKSAAGSESLSFKYKFDQILGAFPSNSIGFIISL